jgi:hypothetical protein
VELSAVNAATVTLNGYLMVSVFVEVPAHMKIIATVALYVMVETVLPVSIDF